MAEKFFLINKNNNLIGGHDYGSMEAATASIKDNNIPEKDAEVLVFSMDCLNDRYIHPENYINNPDSKIRPANYSIRN